MTGRELSRHLATAFVTLMLGAGVYLGFENGPRDIANTVTFPQKLVGVLVTGYGVVGMAAVFGFWGRHRWSIATLWVWAALVASAATLASLVYGSSLWAGLLVAVLSSALVLLVVWVGIWRLRQP